MAINLKERERQIQEESAEKQKSVENWIKDKSRQKTKDSTQNSLPFERILRSGVIKANKQYTQIIEFLDINYQLAPEYKQAEIFNQWCDFLNYFDSSVQFQLLFYNKKKGINEPGESVSLLSQNDNFDDIRLEYSDYLEQQLDKGNNLIKKRKFVAYTVTAEDDEKALLNLKRVERDIYGSFNNIGIQYRTLDFSDVVEILHGILNPDEPRKQLDFNEIINSGLSTKDMVAPMSMNFNKKGTYFKLNSSYNQVGYIQILASELSDRMLAELTDLNENNLIVSFKIEPLEQNRAIKFVKNKLSDIEAMKIEEQKKAVRSGYDMDILPPDLKSNAEESQALLEDLRNRNEHGFMVTITIMATEMTPDEMETSVYQIKNLCQKYNITYRVPIFQQEETLMTTLPLGVNQVYLDRMLTTSSTAIFMPFTTQELFDNSEGSQYYGINQLSNNLVMTNRKNLRNPNGLILGTPGSGKSFGAKRELLDVFLTTEDDILVIDPEKEYAPLVKALNGQVIELSQSSGVYVNPLDINENYSEDDEPIALKTDFVTSLCELILGGKDGLSAVEQSVISRVTIAIYQRYFENPTPENMPIFQDLYEELLKQDEPEAQILAKGMEMYVTGAFNFFNHRTNVDMNNRVINFDISGLGKQLKKLGMLIVQDQIWNRVTINRKKKFTRVYIDEFHLLLRDEQTASYSTDIWKRFRKWWGIPTGITQNIKDLMGSAEIENIFDNTDFILLFNQSFSDREILSQKLQISPSQQQFITNSPAGEGLIISDNIILPIKDEYPEDTNIFKLLSTKPGGE